VNSRLPYVPDDHDCLRHGDAWLHFSSHETDSSRAFVRSLCTVAIRRVVEILDYSPEREIHVCCYHGSQQARASLERQIPPTMAMAPFSSAERGLIVIHSPDLDPMNADESRMTRLLAHELVHLLVAERSQSTKLLGDANENMRVSAWLNEGLAEAVGFRVIAADGRLAAIRKAFHDSQSFHEFGALSQWLDDLDDRRRSLAFAHATAAVDLLCQWHGIRAVFQQLPTIEKFFMPQDVCCPSRLASTLLVLD